MKPNTTLLVGTWLVIAVALHIGGQARANPMDVNDPCSNTQRGPIEPNFAGRSSGYEITS